MPPAATLELIGPLRATRAAARPPDLDILQAAAPCFASNTEFCRNAQHSRSMRTADLQNGQPQIPLQELNQRKRTDLSRAWQEHCSHHCLRTPERAWQGYALGLCGVVQSGTMVSPCSAPSSLLITSFLPSPTPRHPAVLRLHIYLRILSALLQLVFPTSVCALEPRNPTNSTKSTLLPLLLRRRGAQKGAE